MFHLVLAAEYYALNKNLGLEPGHCFYLILPAADNSDLMRIAPNAPKGTLLHCHLDAMLSLEAMLPIAQQMENMHIKSSVPLVTDRSFVEALVDMQLLPSEVTAPMGDVSLFNESYSADDWMSYWMFRELFPGGPKAADDWLVSKIVLQPYDAYRTHRTVNV